MTTRRGVLSIDWEELDRLLEIDDPAACARAYSMARLRAGKDAYLDGEKGFYDRLQDGFAHRVAHMDYGTDIGDDTLRYSAEMANEFARSYIQGVTMSLMAPALLYDTVTTSAEDDPLCIYYMIEQRREEHDDRVRDMVETAGKSAGAVSGAALSISHPWAFITATVNDARQYLERRVRPWLQERYHDTGQDTDEIPDEVAEFFRRQDAERMRTYVNTERQSVAEHAGLLEEVREDVRQRVEAMD